jgi:hypothetical protein
MFFEFLDRQRYGKESVHPGNYKVENGKVKIEKKVCFSILHLNFSIIQTLA